MSSAEARLRAGVVGLGYFSQFHLAAWRRHEDVELVSVCDADAERARRAGDQYSAEAYAALPEMLADHDLDLLDIVAPPSAHAELIRQALSPGRTVICQKPFCTSLDEAQKLAGEAAAIGASLVVHENFRFQPWYREIRRFLDHGQLGNVYQCRFALRPGDGRGRDAYLQRQPSFQSMPRFLIHETAVHFIDVFRWLFGDIESIYADLRQLNPAISGEDAGTLLMSHASGAHSIFDGNRLSDHAAANPRLTMGEMQIEGERGAMRLDGFGRLHFRPFGENDEVQVPVTFPIDEGSFGGGCVDALICHVVAAIRDGESIENRVDDYLDVIAAVDAAYISAASGQKVDLA